MKDFIPKVEKMVKLMGFDEEDIEIKTEEEHDKISLFIDDEAVRGDNTAEILKSFNHIINYMLKSEDKSHCVVDLNYYRKERERLIVELARTAARKATVKEEEIELPPMNSYERRLVHMELKTHPELTTESEGKGKDRRVVIKRIQEET
ncbi:MAG: protein jag [Candidatus Magasanikbacteria bacterium]